MEKYAAQKKKNSFTSVIEWVFQHLNWIIIPDKMLRMAGFQHHSRLSQYVECELNKSNKNEGGRMLQLLGTQTS